jgi:hypothetical protein
MNRLMRLLMRLALRNGWRRGVLQGSRPWLVAGGVALGFRVVARLTGSEAKIVYSEKLLPGETLVIAHQRRGVEPE